MKNQRSANMNKVETLAEMVGGKARLAHIIERHPAVVSKWVRRGRVDTAYNTRIKRALAEIAGTIAGSEAAQKEWLSHALACLDAPICPTCGQSIDNHRVV